MRDFRDAKAMAQTLREALKAKSVSLTHSESLELVARTLGLPDWNFLAARIQASQSAPAVPATGRRLACQPQAVVPILAIRDLVLFPKMVAPIFVGREKTRRAIERALATDRRILVVTQRRSADDDPALDALYAVGVARADRQLRDAGGRNPQTDASPAWRACGCPARRGEFPGGRGRADRGDARPDRRGRDACRAPCSMPIRSMPMSITPTCRGRCSPACCCPASATPANSPIPSRHCCRPAGSAATIAGNR